MALTLTRVFLFISVIACIRFAVGKIEGTFTATDTFQCKWMEKSSNKNLCRDFIINCKKPPTKGYTCTYHGNPHNCAAYNKKQPKFYRQMAVFPAMASTNACSLHQLPVPALCVGTNIRPFIEGPCGSVRERIIEKEIVIDEY